jgi:hypothetical protein
MHMHMHALTHFQVWLWLCGVRRAWSSGKTARHTARRVRRGFSRKGFTSAITPTKWKGGGRGEEKKEADKWKEKGRRRKKNIRRERNASTLHISHTLTYIHKPIFKHIYTKQTQHNTTDKNTNARTCTHTHTPHTHTHTHTCR